MPDSVTITAKTMEGFGAGERHARTIRLLALFVLIALQPACGPEDYQKPIQQFQDASAVVINTTRTFLNNMNIIEQNEQLDDMFFERKPLNLPELNKVEIISPEEIRIRTAALDALTQYTSDLAQLAQGKAGSAVGDSTTKLASSLKTLASDAQKLPPTKATFLDNPKFSGIVGASASAVGAVAQLIVAHKARREIEQSIESNDAAVTSLIEQIGNDATGAYLRQQSQLGAYGDQLTRDYSVEIKGTPDPILLLNLASTIKNYRTQQSQLSEANPATTIDKLKKAHEALVSYLKSGKNPKTFAQFVNAVQDFYTAAQPLGEAVQALISAGKG